MSFQDRTLSCADCNKEFVFSAGEQQFFEERGFSNVPKRCEDCRVKRKAQSQGGDRKGGTRDRNGEKPRFAATCSRCGANFDAPFQPKEGRPVYCRECFTSSKGAGRSSRS